MGQYEQILSYFPMHLRDNLLEFSNVQEIRLRSNKSVCLVKDSKNIVLDFKSTQFDIDFVFENICEHSIHTYQDDINSGFVTLRNGSRVGIAGTAVLEDEKIISIKNITSLNFRVASDFVGCSKSISNLYYNNLIIAGPPNSGKTTFIRDIARNLSTNKKVCVVDERQEICSEHFDNGLMIDCLKGYKKSTGINIAIRTLSPQIIIFDEIGSLQECNGVFDSLNSGIKVITTVHCNGIKQFLLKPVCQKLISSGCFDYVVFLSEEAGKVNKIFKVKGRELCEYLV